MVLVRTNMSRFNFSPCKQNILQGPFSTNFLQGLKPKRVIFAGTKTIF